MDFEFDGGQLAWREEVRDFLRENVTPALVRLRRDRGYEADSEEQRAFRRKVADRGWLALTWPEEYGGRGLSAIYHNILVREFEYFGAPGPDLTVTSVAPMIMRYGTPENRADFLPGIARGEITCAVGYSEPDAGTDLASLRTRAMLVGDEWVVNGRKIWNSRANSATHEWLCVRTDPDAPKKYEGISVIMVPIDTPGIHVRPLTTWGDSHTFETLFDDVRVPRRNLIGEPNLGWRYITGALDLERGAAANVGDLRRAVDDLIRLVRNARPDGSRPAVGPEVAARIARLDGDVEAATLMSLEAASLIEAGEVPTVAATALKIFASELRQRIADTGTAALGLEGLLHGSDDHSVDAGAFEKLYRTAPLQRFAGGTNEVLRDTIAQRGQGLPASRR